MGKKFEIMLLGAGSHAVAVVDLLESTKKYSIRGLLDDRETKGSAFLDYLVLGSFNYAGTWIHSEIQFLVSVGQIGRPGLRERLFRDLISVGAPLATPVSPFAYVSARSSLGMGTAVFHGAVVNAGATVGENCIINSMSLVEHDASVGHHTHIATGARVNGGATIGSRCFVGSGALIFQGCQVPDDSVIPAGAVVKRWPLSP